MDKEFVGILAGAVSLVAYAPYIYSIFQYKTKPSRSSWWIWSFIGLIILVSYYYAGARNTIWIPVVFFICPLIIAILSLRYGSGNGLGWLDKFCLIIAVISLMLWYFLESPVLALLINLFVDFLGFLPTFQKTYTHKKSENRFAWTLFFMGSMLNVIAIEQYNFSIILYPLYMLMMDSIMTYLLFVRKVKFIRF